MKTYLIKNASIINEGEQYTSDLLIKDGYIDQIEPGISANKADELIEADGLYMLPGVIDDQVHFREPGLTHKADIYSESRAAVAGGITSFMEMPNTKPPAITQQLLSDKYKTASRYSLANYSFFMGASNDNLNEVLQTNFSEVCGVNVFMGASTGNMLVYNQKTLENLFKECPALIATHCEDEATIQQNFAYYKNLYGDDIPVHLHPAIRSEEACFKSSSMATELAKKHEARLHVLHISTEKELALFSNQRPLSEKKITAEACIHHLWFNDKDYEKLGTRIKWNPAIKTEQDQQAVMAALLNDQIDVIATDHAPHTLEEKQNPYTKAPSGAPMVQHSLPCMLELYHQGKISLVRIAEKMAHAPATLFRIPDRGFIKEGYKADLVLANLNCPWQVNTGNILYKCGWSPLEGQYFSSCISTTFVSGHPVYREGIFDESRKGERLSFRNV